MSIVDFSNLHVGLTNRCRLLCPECARTTVGGRYVHNMFDLDHEYFNNFLLNCGAKEILFCGNWGDPIYSKNFVELVESIKTNNPNVMISIHTNGSGKSIEFWKKLVSVLNEQDNLIFSIDGTPDNYNLYRINSKWEDVEQAVVAAIEQKQSMEHPPRITWKHIVFSYNENTIYQSYELSKTMGFDDFVLQQSMVNDQLWLKTKKTFTEIKEEFDEQKNQSLL